MNNAKKGEYGEAVVLGFLEAKGYILIVQNYKRASGEIDIVAKDRDYIVFIEVKYRRGRKFGTGFDNIAGSGQNRRIIKTAKIFLYENGLWEANCRFDIIEVFGREGLEIEHIENAFWE